MSRAVRWNRPPVHMPPRPARPGQGCDVDALPQSPQDSADEAKKKRKMAGLWFLRVDWDGKKEDAGRGEEGRGGQEGVGFTPEPPLPRYRAI